MTDKLIFAGTVEAEGRTIKGSVVLVGSRTFRNGEWLEVDPAALVKADAKDVKGRFDHDPGKVMGRTGNGTVRLSRTETGIDYEIDVNETSFGNDALVMARRGDFGGSSFEIEGLRSTFSTDPDGTRVRRITSIKRLTDVSPVIDPAFANSTVAAFSKETDVSETVIETPAAPAPPAAPPAVESVARSDTFETTERFARTLDKASLENAMDDLVSGGDLTGDKGTQYEAYAKVYGEISKAESADRERAERFALMHNVRLGRKPAAPASGNSELFASEDYSQAFNRYLGGDVRVMEQFAQSIAGDGTQGGFAVPDGFLNRLTKRRKAFGGIEAHADILTTSDGTSLRWPSNDDTGNTAGIAAEGSASAAGADLTLGNLSLGAFTFDATGASNLPVKVSKELLQDSSIDFGGRVADALGERLGRKMAASFATGVGTTEPFGLFAKTPDAMTATTAYAAFVEMFFQVDQWYRDAAVWIVSDTVLAKVYNSVDDEGRPLFTPAASAGGQSAPAGTILGKPVHLDQGAAGLVAFGDIRAGFIIRHVRGITIDVDPYSYISTRQIGYHAWCRANSAIQDTYAVSVSDFASVTADAE